ncbi:MAG: N-acetylmuramoyl-L-alanine amidase [Sorangiineae bacterium]|nr:N-acetylmuramoyl-L-alanine amidase [Polyangiaceae bacterium]MEB2321408.1 N-acetylmuramoyl-L-alanine amidase [Sorangiineae bacterium]
MARVRLPWLAVVAVTLGASACSGPAAPPESTGPVGRRVDALARRHGVPRDLVLAIAVEETGLTLPKYRVVSPADLVPIAGILELRHGKLDTLALGASLMGMTEAALSADTELGTEAGVRVLATLGPTGDDQLASWRDAIAKLSGLADPGEYVARVYSLLRYGGSFPARDGEAVVIAAHPEIPLGLTIAPPRAAPLATPDFPGSEWFDTSCTNKCNTNRPDGNAAVDTVVIHDTEGGWNASVATLQYDSGKSVHYIIDADGSRWGQFVPETYTAWHAGNYCYNKHSIGIEHVGVASDPAGYSDALYAKSVEMVKSIATRWAIPLDRDHVVGHYQMPNGDRIAECSPPCGLGLDACESSADYGGSGNHTDPGYHWQWCQYMERLGSSCKCNDAWPLWNCTTDKTQAWRCNAGTLEKGECTAGCESMPIGTDDVCHVAAGTGGSAGATGLGGAAGVAGSTASGGAAGGGWISDDGGASGGASGASGVGGADAGALPAKGSSGDDGGCSCAVPRSRERAPLAPLALAGLGLALLRRHERGRRARS